MKKILLYPRERNLYALVDDADYERVNQYRWYARKHRRVIRAIRPFITETQFTFRPLHIEVMGKAPAGMVIDHKNRDPLDCRRENLRFCTPQQNGWNRGPNRSRRYSRYKSVLFYWNRKNGVKRANPKPWHVQVVANGKSHRRGMFADEKEAYDVAVELIQRLHGEFACVQPWEGYSDNPELRQLLGRKNGPPNKRQIMINDKMPEYSSRKTRRTRRQ